MTKIKGNKKRKLQIVERALQFSRIEEEKKIKTEEGLKMY
jgi:hypothetical protein